MPDGSIIVTGAGRADEVARFVAMLFAERNGFLTGRAIDLGGGQGMNR